MGLAAVAEQKPNVSVPYLPVGSVPISEFVDGVRRRADEPEAVERVARDDAVDRFARAAVELDAQVFGWTTLGSRTVGDIRPTSSFVSLTFEAPLRPEAGAVEPGHIRPLTMLPTPPR